LTRCSFLVEPCRWCFRCTMGSSVSVDGVGVWGPPVWSHLSFMVFAGVGGLAEGKGILRARVGEMTFILDSICELNVDGAFLHFRW
jgi:hypothetical protein